MNDFDVIVIGGGPAGVTAALRARELGARVALVERGALGGVCTNDGCAPTRVLAKTARLMRDTRNFHEFGLVGERPALDWERLMTRSHYVVNALHEKKQLLGHLQAAGISAFVGVGAAAFTGPHSVVFGKGEERTELHGEKIIVCAGGHARRLPFPGAEYALTHSDVWTIKQLPPRVAIIGGAATGCQLASILHEFGSDVTLLELAPRLVPGEDEMTSRILYAEFEGRGMRLETGIGGVTRIEHTRAGLQLIYLREGNELALEVDAVIVAVGWVGNVESLNLDAAGVRTERGYIVVNDALQSSAPHIYAAGDLTGRIMLVQTATQEGMMAAENAVSPDNSSFVLGKQRVVPHGGFTDPEYGSVGLTETQAQAQFPGGYIAATVPYSDLDRAVIDEYAAGFCKLIVARETRQILGAHVVGEQALEVVEMVAAAMAGETRIGTLAVLEIAYPTYAAIVGLTARRIVRALDVPATDAAWGELGKRYSTEWEIR